MLWWLGAGLVIWLGSSAIIPLSWALSVMADRRAYAAGHAAPAKPETGHRVPAK